MNLGEIVGTVPRPPQDELVIAVACDSKYAGRYLAPLLYSINQNRPGSYVHVHIMDPQPGIEEGLALFATDLIDTYLTWTLSNPEPTNLPPEGRWSLYACGRFFLARFLSGHGIDRMFLLDVDSIVRGPFGLPPGERVGLFIREQNPDHMKIAAGAVYLSGSIGGLFIDEVCRRLNTATPKWFVDQRVLWGSAIHVLADPTENAGGGAGSHLLKLTKHFLDWEWDENSAIWTGKGPRKETDPVYTAAVDRYRESGRADHVINRFWGPNKDGQPRALILSPYMDMPFKRPKLAIHNSIGESALHLRERWTEIAWEIKHALDADGWNAQILTRPMWEYSPALVDAYQADLVFVPHKQRRQFPCKTPALFYMQTPLPFAFSIDPNGWGAEVSIYEQIEESVFSAPYDNTITERLRNYVGANLSKFEQPAFYRKTRSELEESGVIPTGNYVFFPCQIPHDENIRDHSDVHELILVENVCRWAQENNVPVVFKGHPANPASMKPLFEAVEAFGKKGAPVRWVDGISVHELLQYAWAVMTINSGVGLEALIWGKPVVTFGRSEYDCVTIRATRDDLVGGDDVLLRDINGMDDRLLEGHAPHAAFLSWFLTQYAIDLDGDNDARRKRIADLARQQMVGLEAAE